MIRLQKRIIGYFNCLDSQMLEYSVSFECIFKYNIFDYFKIKKNTSILINIIEHNIRDVMSNNKMKYFNKDNLKTYQKEYSKYVDLKKTNKAQRNIENIIKDQLTIEFKGYNYDIVKFQIIPCDICHSLRAALS